MFDRNGTSPADGIALMLDMQELLEQNPVAGLSAIAQSFGIDLAATFGGNAAGQQQQAENGAQRAVDPNVAALVAQNRQLQQRLVARDTQDRRESERQQTLRRQEASESVQKWSEGKEHFARTDVRKAMSALYAQGLATDLDHAYEQACNAIPEVRALLKAEADKKALAEQAKSVADAKRAIPGRAGTRTAVPVKAGRWDADEALEATYDSIAAA